MEEIKSSQNILKSTPYLELLVTLKNQPLTFSQIWRETNKSKSIVSRQLKELEDKEIIFLEDKKYKINYEVLNKGLESIKDEYINLITYFN